MTDTDPSLDPRPRTTIMLSLLMFLLGACGLAYEYTLSKIASDLLGNSVQQWATMIATMLFAMGLGADLQKRITHNLADLLVRSQIYLALLGGYGPLILLGSFAAIPAHYILVQYTLALAVGTLIGFEIPLIMRLNESEMPEMRFNLAQVLKMDYVGALIGALLWTFVMIRWLGIERISFVLALSTLACALLSLSIFRERITHWKSRWLELGSASILVAIGFIYGEPLSLKAEQALYRDPIVHVETTPYQHVVLTSDRHDTLRCYINGHLQFDAEDEFIYHECLVHPAMHLHPNAKKILVLGGGDGLAVRELLKYPTVESIVLVDIDPAITRLASTHPALTSLNNFSLTGSRVKIIPPEGISQGAPFILEERNQRRPVHPEWHPVTELKILNIDAGQFVQSASGQFDLAILDFPDPSSPDLAKLYSRLFYENLKHQLKPAGLIVQQGGSPVHAKQAFLCIGRTLAASGFHPLPYHDNVPSFGEWGWWIAWKSPPSNLAQTIATLSDLDQVHVPTRYLTPQLLGAAFHFGHEQLLTSATDITSLTKPRIYDYYLQGWQSR